MEPYSREFRAEVLAHCDSGEGTKAVALHFKVSESWVRRIKQQRRETGQVAPKTAAARKPAWLSWADWLRDKIKAQPDIYLHELQSALEQEKQEEVSLMTICTACRKLGLTRKKRR